MSELTKELIATEERQDLEPVGSKDRDTENSTVPSMASPPSATTPPERATAGILVSDKYVIHPWYGECLIMPIEDANDLETLAEHGLPAGAMQVIVPARDGIAVGLDTEEEREFAFGPYASVDQAALLRQEENAHSYTYPFLRQAIDDLLAGECVLVESEGPEGAPRLVNGKELRPRPWVLSVGWAQEGALPRWVFTVIDDPRFYGLLVHEPSRTPLAVWAHLPDFPTLTPPESTAPPTEEEARDVHVVRAILTECPMGSTRVSRIARTLGVSTRVAKRYLDGLAARLDFVCYSPGSDVQICEFAKARMWLAQRLNA